MYPKEAVESRRDGILHAFIVLPTMEIEAHYVVPPGLRSVIDTIGILSEIASLGDFANI